MNSKSPLLLVLVGLLLAGGVGWLLFSDPGQEAHAIASVDQREVPVASHQPSELSTPEAIDAPRDEAPVVEREEAPTPKRVSHTDSIWIEGRIVFPADTPPDELVTVIARGKKFKGKEEDPKLYEADADQSGRFRVAFAKGTKRGRLSIRAKYLYLEKSIKLTRKKFDQEALIEPLLGGCIEVTLLAPPGSSLSPEEIEGCEIGGWTGEYTERFSAIEAKHIEGPLFRIAALEPDSGYELSLESNDFVNFDRKGLDVKAGEIVSVEFALEVGARVTGRVVDGTGQPLEDVQLSFQTSRHWRFQTTDVSGEFDRGGLDGGKLTIAAKKEGVLDVEDFDLQLTRGESITGIEIRMDSGNSITGVVTWPDGTPAAKARVVVEQERADGQERYYGIDAEYSEMTDSDGLFTITGLTADKCAVRARAKRDLKAEGDESERERRRRKKAQPYWNVALDDVPTSSGLITLVLRESTGIPGVVVDDLGSAIEDFKVVAVPVSDELWGGSTEGQVSLKVKDAADGGFFLEGLKDGSFEVYATARGHKMRARQRIEVPWKGGTLTLVVPRSASIAGVVYDLEGQPVAGARVEQVFDDSVGSVFFSSTERTDKTDKDGAYELKSLTAGTSRVRALATGFANSEWREVILEPGQELTGFALNLRAGATLTGVIHPSVGTVAGVTVNLEFSGPEEDRSTISDSSGAFRFERVDSGECTLSIEPDMSDMDNDDSGYWTVRLARSQQLSVELVDGEQQHVILGAPFGKPIVVTGLVSVSGEPAGKELITVEIVGGGTADHEIYTDAEGIYTLTLDGPGQYRFSVGEGWGESLSFVRDIPDTESYRCDIELPAATLSGIVRGPEGELLPGIRVTLDPVQLENSAVGSQSDFREAQTDETGRFTFERLHAASYTLRAGGSDIWGLQTSGKYGRHVIAGLKVEEGKQHEDLTIDLSRAGTIQGTVRDATGALIPHVELRVVLEGGQNLELWGGHRSDASGHFKIRGIAPGTVQIIAQMDGDSEVEARVEVFSGEKTEVELVLN